MRKQELITLSTLGAIALCVVLLYCLVFAPMLFKEDEQILPEIAEGEGIYLSAYVTLYPEIASNNIVEISVNNEHGSYAFYMRTSSSGAKEMVIKGHEDLKYAEMVYAYLIAYTRLPVVPQGSSIYRDVDSSKMANYGLTDDTCLAKYTITYKEANGEENSHTVLIGNKIMSSGTIYYAAVQGRNNVYTINGSGIEGAILKSLPSFVDPVIYTNFESASEAALTIDQFGIFLTNPENENDLKTVVMLNKDKIQSGTTGAVYYLTCEKIYPQKVMASSTYITNAFGQLYTTFVGDETVAIVPKDEGRQEVLEKYGLGTSQEHFSVFANGSSSDRSINFHISKVQEDGYIYVLSQYYTTDIVVRVDSTALSFIGEGEETALKWAATNSVYAGFNDYLVPPDDETPYVSTIRIKTKKNGFNYDGYEQTFVVKQSPNGGYLFESTDGKYSFDTTNNTSDNMDLFSTFYTVLIVMPKPQAFSQMTNEEKLALQTEDNLLFELEVVLNNRVCKKYSYYYINSGYALCVSELGSLQSENGVTSVVYDSKESVFEASVSHISSVSKAFEMTLLGQHYVQNDFIT